MADFILQTPGTYEADDLSGTSATVSFRDIIPKPDHPRVAGISSRSALSWCESRRQIEAPAWLMMNGFDKKNSATYHGFTATGAVEDGVY